MTAAMMVCIASNFAFAAPIDEPNEIELTAPPESYNGTDSKAPAKPGVAIDDSLQDVDELEEIKQAKAALINNDVELCREKLRAAYAKHPNLSPPEMMLARLFLSAGHLATGRRLLEEVSIADPDHPEVYLLFGKLALNDGHVTDAAVQFEKALSFELPEIWTDAQRKRFRAECIAGRTAIAELKRDWREAAELLQQQVKAQPRNAILRDRFAMALFRDGQLRQAYEQFDIAYHQNTKLSQPEVSMAAMCVEQANYRKADEWFEKALSRYPDDASVHFERSIALMHEDRAAEADRHAEKAAEQKLDHEGFLMHRGIIAMQLGEFERAASYFHSVFERTQYIGAKTSLALALAEQDDDAKRKQALELAQEAAKSRPDSPMVQSILGWVQFRNGQVAEAEASLRGAVARMPNDRSTLLFYSRVLMHQQREDEARKVGQQLKQVVDQPGIHAFRPAAREWLKVVLSEKK